MNTEAPYKAGQKVRLTKFVVSCFRPGDELTIESVSNLDGQWFIYARGVMKQSVVAFGCDQPIGADYVPPHAIEAA